MTLPKGVGPFVEKLLALGAVLDARQRRHGPGHDIAEAIERLIASGHPPAVVWTYTPRQLAGFLALAGQRARADAAAALSIQHAALHMKPRDLRKAIRDLSE